MLKRLCTWLVVICVIVYSTAFSEESAFDTLLKQCIKIQEPLPEGIPQAAYLYQCMVLSSVLYPGISIVQLDKYLQSENLQPIDISVCIENGKKITTYAFSQYYKIKLYGDPVENCELLLCYLPDEDKNIALPLDISWTAQTITNGTNPLISDTYVDIHNIDINDFIEWYRTSIASDDQLDGSGMAEMIQYAVFSSLISPSKSMDDIRLLASRFPLLADSEFIIDPNEYTWIIRSKSLGEMTAFCVFIDGHACRTGFSLSMYDLGRLCYPYLLFDFGDTSTGQFYTYSPNVYVNIHDQKELSVY